MNKFFKIISICLVVCVLFTTTAYPSPWDSKSLRKSASTQFGKTEEELRDNLGSGRTDSGFAFIPALAIVAGVALATLSVIVLGDRLHFLPFLPIIPFISVLFFQGQTNPNPKEQILSDILTKYWDTNKPYFEDKTTISTLLENIKSVDPKLIPSLMLEYPLQQAQDEAFDSTSAQMRSATIPYIKLLFIRLVIYSILGKQSTFAQFMENKYSGSPEKNITINKIYRALISAYPKFFNEVLNNTIAKSTPEKDKPLIRYKNLVSINQILKETVVSEPTHVSESTNVEGTKPEEEATKEAKLEEKPKIGKYEIIKKLGEGGMGQVFLGLDAGLNRHVAIKILPRDRFTDQSMVDRFKREAEALAKLSHPAIVQVYEFEQDNDKYYLAMEYVNGIPLDKYIDNERISAKDAVYFILGAAEAIEYAHQKGIIHRDIKPSNLMVAEIEKIDVENGEKKKAKRLKVLDFGLAKEEGKKTLTQADQTVGTPVYMSPEQAEGSKLDQRTDIYSLGCVLYELLAKEPPFEGDTVAQILYKKLAAEVPPDVRKKNHLVSADLAAIVQKMMERDPKRRYHRMSEVVADLRSLQDEQPVRAHPVGFSSRLVRKMMRNKITTALIAAIVMILIIASGIIFHFATKPPERIERPAITAPQKPPVPAEAKALFDKADERRKKYAFDDAAKLYSDAVDKYPNYSEALAQRGLAHLGKCDFEKAKKDLFKAIEKDPENAEAYVARAEYFLFINDYNNARKDLSRAVEIDPKNFRAHLLLSNLHSRLNNMGQAKHEFDKAYEIEPNNPNAIVNRADHNYMLDRDEKKARAEYQRVINANSELVFVYRQFGTFLLKINKFNEALEWLNKALQLNPFDYTAYDQRAICRKEAGDNAGAIEDYEKAIRLCPYYSLAYSNLAILLTEMGKPEKALEYYRKAVEMDPQNAKAYADMGIFYFKDLKNKKKALELLSEALKIDPNLETVHFGLAIIYFESDKDIDKALGSLNRAISINPDYINALVARSVLYMERNMYNEAMVDCNKVLLIEPENVEGLGKRATLFARIGKFNEALADYNKAIEISPLASLYINRGFLYYKMGNFDLAIKDFEKSLALQPTATVYANIAAIYLRRKQYQEALSVIDKALEFEPDNVNINHAKAVIILESQGDMRIALKYATKAIELDPNYAEAYFTRGGIHFKLEDYLNCIKDMQRFIEEKERTEPNNPKIQLAKQYIEEARKRLKEKG